MQYLIKAISLLATAKYRIFCRSRISFGKNFIANFKFKISGPGKVTFGENCNCWANSESNMFITYTKEARISIGSNCRINGVSCFAREKISIGENGLIGSAIIMDNDFHNSDPILRKSKKDIPTRPVIIGNNVWLCGQSAVLKGVTIGDNSVIGFRCVAVTNVPENVITAGNPQQIVKKL